MAISRRHLLQGGAFVALTPALGTAACFPTATPAYAEGSSEPVWRHALSLFGDIKYPAGFKRFDYVNPDAPKAGVVRQITVGTFDNFNMAVAGVKGTIAPAVGHIFETLTVESQDEPESRYGLLAEAACYPDDFSWVKYRLNKQARWHDGNPVIPEDVIFSFEVLKKYSPQAAFYYRHVVKAEKTGENEITFTFDGAGNRELPTIMGQLTVLPKHWWEGTDSDGKKRDVSATTLEKPLGSGPYRIKEFVAGRSVTLERVKDYWGLNHPTQTGSNNFEELRFEFFRDNVVALEAFKADQVDWILENSAKQWATAYDFPAVTEKRVIKEQFPIRSVGRMQGFAFNLRRDTFKDARLRRAFNYAFDFEEMNKQLFYGAYKRINSYFAGVGEFMSSGLPEGEELAILQSVKDKVPAEVFTTAYVNPVGGNPENVRSNLRESTRLLKEAGFEVKDRKLVDPSGKPVSVEFLTESEPMERLMLFYKPSLERLGVAVSIRRVDSAQYENRVRTFDFDLTTNVWPESLSPGNEQREFWGSQAASSPGSQNLCGIQNPAVDTLIDRIIFAKNRADLVASCKALDRVLLWNFYCVPHYMSDTINYARWDRFSHPDPLPQYGVSGFPTLWWWDADKAAKIGKRS
ncbi:MAG TPA: extracellular solute-binding protein [Bradyrhizobium sp.]|nr:extracellular solute-binding protein [Bradyrhizobium sp.]